MSLLFFLVIGCHRTLPPPVPAESEAPVSIAGDWSGRLDVGNGLTLGLQFHLDEAGTGTMDSVDQGADDIPVAWERTDDVLVIEVPVATAAFRAPVSADRLAGEWTQAGASLPLVLVPGLLSEPLRPQEPELPLPYPTEDVTFPGPAGALAGTFVDVGGPTVVFLTGSGPQDRDEALLGHRPFYVIADHLARHGISSLRFDDRGVGASEGVFADATVYDFAEDAVAAFRYAETRAHGPVGFLGHSEGAMTAPTAAQDVDAAFLVLLAPPAVPIPQLMLEQTRAAVRSMGGTQAEADAAVALNEKVYAAIGTAPSTEALERLLVEAELPPDDAETYARTYGTDWWRAFLTFEPVAPLAALDVPVLALFGDKDTQVLAPSNAEGARSALADNPRATVEVVTGANHLFQPAETGAVAEYAQIETTVMPSVLDRISSWITAL